MKILFFCHYFPPEVNAPASRTYENAKRWVLAGHQVTVITSAPNAPRGEIFPGYTNRLRHVEWVDGIRVVRVWTHLAPNKGTWRRILNYLTYMLSATLAAQFEKRPDVMVATSPQFFCGWAGVLTHWMRRWPFVLEIRDIWPESITAVGAMKKGIATRLLESMERRMYAAADHIVAVGQGYRENLLSKGVPPEKVSVVYNGVDLEMFKPGPKDPAFTRRFGLEGRKVCGYIGTVGMAHGLEVMLEAADRSRNEPWTFIIVGDGARADELRADAESRGLSNLVFTGRLSKQEMPAAWSSLDICLIHLRGSDLFKTVIPSKMFEAMGMAVPILMGVEGESLGIVEEAGAGIPMLPDDAESLLAGCRTMFAEIANRYGVAGREYVTRKFDRDVLAGRYLEILESVRSGRTQHLGEFAPFPKTPQDHHDS